MKSRRTHDPDMPLGKLTQVKDFLPPPEKLVFQEPQVKITVSVYKSSVDFLKREAKKNNTHYQKMIRSVLAGYMRMHSQTKR